MLRKLIFLDGYWYSDGIRWQCWALMKIVAKGRKNSSKGGKRALENESYSRSEKSAAII